MALLVVTAFSSGCGFFAVLGFALDLLVCLGAGVAGDFAAGVPLTFSLDLAGAGASAAAFAFAVGLAERAFFAVGVADGIFEAGAFFAFAFAAGGVFDWGFALVTGFSAGLRATLADPAGAFALVGDAFLAAVGFGAADFFWVRTGFAWPGEVALVEVRLLIACDSDRGRLARL